MPEDRSRFPSAYDRARSRDVGMAPQQEPPVSARIRTLIFDALGGNSPDMAKRRRAMQAADMLTGAGAEFAMGMTPVLGDAQAMYEAKQAYDQGNMGRAAMLGGLGALGMVPVVGDIAKKGGELAMDAVGNASKVAKQMFPEANRITNINRAGPMWSAIARENPIIRSSPEMVTVYRATIGNEIRPNDFVALNGSIAKDHLQNLIDRGEKAKIITAKVPLSSLLMANDATEFIYYPPN
jgi:hypothetical protein